MTEKIYCQQLSPLHLGCEVEFRHKGQSHKGKLESVTAARKEIGSYGARTFYAETLLLVIGGHEVEVPQPNSRILVSMEDYNKRFDTWLETVN